MGTQPVSIKLGLSSQDQTTDEQLSSASKVNEWLNAATPSGLRRKTNSLRISSDEESSAETVTRYKTALSTTEREAESLDDLEQPTSTELIKELRLEEFFSSFQQLCWDVASTGREEDATADQRENVQEIHDILKFWMSVECEKTIEEAGIKGDLIGSLLLEMAERKGTDLRNLPEYLELILEDTYKKGSDWTALFQDETSEVEISHNKMLDSELCLMRDKERGFLVAFLYSLDRDKDSEIEKVEESEDIVKELAIAGKGKEVVENTSQQVRWSRGYFVVTKNLSPSL